MRSLNIDEVPQFWNVIKGEMSLVGPRPERPELIETFKEQIPHYNARHGIKPGHHGLGAGKRFPWRHRPRRAHQVRPLLHGKLEPAAWSSKSC